MHRTCRPALVIKLLSLNDLFDQPGLIVLVQNREVGFQADYFGMTAQHTGCDGVKGPNPQSFGRTADHTGYPIPHFPRRLVGKGDGKYLVGPRTASDEDMGNTGGQYPGLSGTGPGKYQQGTVNGLYRLSLRIVQTP